MLIPPTTSFIQTIPERCRMCYTCVRECPAKAIRIVEGQAEIMPERCISCGNCVRVCSQNAKQVLSAVDQVQTLLNGPHRVAACLAPTFPAEFADLDYTVVVGMIRQLGFDRVQEVAFGADLVARRYRELLDRKDGKRYISTACPSIIGFVEKYHPDLVGCLVPIVSPMIAIARILKHLHGDEIKIVFIGPCIAKKCEAISVEVADEIDAVLTFAELRQMCQQHAIEPGLAVASDFDEPHAGLGALFPISRGLLQAADIEEDLMAGEVVATDGRTNFVPAIREFEAGALDSRLLEVLACNGCIMGAGMTTEAPLFSRRSLVSRYVRSRMGDIEQRKWHEEMDKVAHLDLSRLFLKNDQRIPVPFEEEIRQIMAKMGKYQPEDELNCGACGYDTCREHAEAIFKGLAENEMCLPNTIEQLRRTVKDLATSNDQLASAQQALMQSEKLASMGQLAAGIAHEVNNPLGVVLMYAHLLRDQFKDEPQLREDLEMIVEQSDRCKKIVAGLLHFARQNKVHLAPTDIGKLIDRVVMTVSTVNDISIRVHRDTDIASVDVDADQMVQVLVNLINNAQAAMPQGGHIDIRIAGDAETLLLEVADEGTGIEQDNIPKLFEPFYSTKKMGMGTGLGLAVTYGIIKMHCGDIKVTSNADPAAGPTGTTFVITLPRKGQNK